MKRTRPPTAKLCGPWSIACCATVLAGCAWWRRAPVERPQDSIAVTRDGHTAPAFAPEAPQATVYLGPARAATCERPAPAGRSTARVCREAAGSHQVECRQACLDSELPDEAARHQVGAVVSVTYRIGDDGVFDDVAATRDPGCALGAAAARALRRCCVVVPTPGRALSQLVGARGCHAIALHLPGYGR